MSSSRKTKKIGECFYSYGIICTRFPPGFRQVSARFPLRGQPGFRQVSARACGRETRVSPPSGIYTHAHICGARALQSRCATITRLFINKRRVFSVRFRKNRRPRSRAAPKAPRGALVWRAYREARCQLSTHRLALAPCLISLPSDSCVECTRGERGADVSGWHKAFALEKIICNGDWRGGGGRPLLSESY